MNLNDLQVPSSFWETIQADRDFNLPLIETEKVQVIVEAKRLKEFSELVKAWQGGKLDHLDWTEPELKRAMANPNNPYAGREHLHYPRNPALRRLLTTDARELSKEELAELRAFHHAPHIKESGRPLMLIDWVPRGRMEDNRYALYVNALGQKWKHTPTFSLYVESQPENLRPYLRAFQQVVIRDGIWYSAEWHQDSKKGSPVFSDRVTLVFDQEAWGQFMATVWGEELNEDYSWEEFLYERSLPTLV